MQNIKTYFKNEKPFVIAIIALIILASSLIIMTSFFSFNNVRDVKHLGEQDSAQLKNQNFLITFDRPMQNDSVQDLISFEPQLKFSTTWNGRSLFVRVDDVLKPGIDYKMTIQSDIKDLYDTSMKEDFVYQFKTESVSYFYLVETGGDKRILEVDLISGEQSEIYSSESLLDFYVQKPYLVVIEGEVNHKIASLINIDTGDRKEIFVPERHVIDVKFHPTQPEVWAIMQEVFKEANVTVPIGNKQIFRYIIPEDKTRKVLLSSEIQSLDGFSFSPSGTDLLIEESFSERFSIMDSVDPLIWSPLGKYVSSSGYDVDGKNLLFINLNWANLQEPSWIELRNSDGEKVVSDKSISSIDPLFFEEYIAYSSQYMTLTTERAAYDVHITDFDGEIIKKIHQDGYSLEYSDAYIGKRYLLIRGYALEDLTEPFTFVDRLNSIPAPPKFKVFIYDIESDTLVDTEVVTSVSKFEDK